MKAFANRVGRRLALREAFGWPAFWIAAFVYFGTTVLFDAGRFGGPLWLWSIGWLLGQGVLVLFVWASRKAFLDSLINVKVRILATLLVGTAAGISRGLFIGFFSLITGLAPEIQYAFRIGGGGIAGLVLTVAGSSLIGAATEHNEVVARLKQVQADLLETRRSAPALLEKARADIALLAERTLLPRLTAIENALLETKVAPAKLESVSGQIRAMINLEVRPMSSSLAEKVERSLSFKPEEPNRGKRVLGLPTSFNLSSAISPGISFGVALMLCLSTFAPLSDPKTTALSLIGALALLIGLHAFRWILRPLPKVNLSIGTVILALLGAISTIPLSLLTQSSLPKYLNLSGMPIESAFVMAVLLVGIGYTKIVDDERTIYERELDAFNSELAHELKWIDAQIWVIRREWAYLIHGRVQSALTAAITRLGDPASLNQKTVNAALKDLDRARQALFNGITKVPFELDSSLKEIKDSWAGICEITTQFDEVSRRTIIEDTGIARSLNEIIREAVSNAVRHGSATQVHVKLEESASALMLTISNDGNPVTKASRRSLGTDMLNELTLSWSLRNEKQPKRVVLEAKLAKATSFSS